MALGQTDQKLISLPHMSKKRTSPHPLAPLLADEIATVSSLVQATWPEATDLHFKSVTLEEPPKKDVLLYLHAEHGAGNFPSLSRKAFVSYYIRNTNRLHEAIVDLSQGAVESNVRLGANIHAPGDGEEILKVERIALEDEGVQAEIRKLQLPQGAVVVSDPWIYGSDGIDDDQRMWQCFLYMRDPANPHVEDSNHYSFPLPVSPVICSTTWKVIRIDIMPTGIDHIVKPVAPWKAKPGNEYVPECQQLRPDLKPLNVVQPEGVSFTVEEQGSTNIIRWQKWDFRLGFNLREGMVFHDVRYDNRSLFYRLSLSDMNIPYADPRHPFHKKAAFDLGDVGAGLMANNLQLGCDCLGSIYYLSAVLNDDKGQPLHMPNVVCIHEQDNGIGWKHTNYRTGRACVVRNRQLVIQSIITVANYEYIMNVIFDQAGNIEYEVRATGILSTQPIDEGCEVPFGTVVHPGVLAVHHQHIFSLRVDPHIDGSTTNRLVYDEAIPMPRGPTNPHGTGYTVQETAVSKSGGYDLNTATNRTFKVQNAAVRNPVNGKPVGYKILAPPFQYMLADESSFHHARAEFADHNLYVTAYRDGELYAGGKYTNQSRGGTGVRAWAARGEDVLDRDLVLFVNFGMNHITRTEDFPVMPCEVLKVVFKPVNFFDRNPAIDVPPSSQAVNQSTALNGNGVVEDGSIRESNGESAAQQHRQSEGVAVVNGNGVCCTNGGGRLT